ncbi:dihydropteroate synthase [Cryomorphaceae bacterium 1068]|nr:dihydropteroate synthase [Cryomorphaceae bacterium 1068]
MKINGEIRVFNKPLTMGILNLTDDSFYAGSRVSGRESILAKAEEMLIQGADILDLGAYSTRPGADDISAAQETERLIGGIKAIKDKFPEAILSADTFRAEIARKAVEAGVAIINDVGSGVVDQEMFDTVADLGVPYVLMHNRGTPKTMNSLANYTDVVNEVVFELSQKLDVLRRKGVADVIIDPGFGFAKTVDHNFEMLLRLDEFKMLGCPILVGVSRKSMIWRTLGTSAEEALNGTTALNMVALQKGASILRVHDVKEARECVELAFRHLGYSSAPLTDRAR